MARTTNDDKIPGMLRHSASQRLASSGAAPSTSQSQANDNSEAAWTGGASQRPAQGGQPSILRTTPRPLPIAPASPTFGRRADASGAIQDPGTSQYDPSSALQAVNAAFQYGRQLHGLPTDAQDGAIPVQQQASNYSSPKQAPAPPRGQPASAEDDNNSQQKIYDALPRGNPNEYHAAQDKINKYEDELSTRKKYYSNHPELNTRADGTPNTSEGGPSSTSDDGNATMHAIIDMQKAGVDRLALPEFSKSEALELAPKVSPPRDQRSDQGAIPDQQGADNNDQTQDFAAGGGVPNPDPDDEGDDNSQLPVNSAPTSGADPNAPADPNPPPGQGGPQYNTSNSSQPASAGALDMGAFDAPESGLKRVRDAIGRVGRNIGSAISKSLPGTEEAAGGGANPADVYGYLSGAGAASKETMEKLRGQAEDLLRSNGSDIEGGLAAETVHQAKSPAEANAVMMNLRNDFGHFAHSAMAAVDGGNNKPSNPALAVENANRASKAFPDGNKVEWSYRKGATAADDAYMATVTPPVTGNSSVDRDNAPKTYSLTGPQFKGFLHQGQAGQFDKLFHVGYGNTLEQMQQDPGIPLTPRTTTQHGWEPAHNIGGIDVMSRSVDRTYVVDRDGKVTNEATPEDAKLHGGAQNVQRNNEMYPNMGGGQDQKRLQGLEAGRQQDIKNEQAGTKIGQPLQVAQIRGQSNENVAGIAGQAKTDSADTLAGSREYGADARANAAKYVADMSNNWHTNATQAKMANDLQNIEIKRLDAQDQSAVKFLASKVANSQELTKDEVSSAARLVSAAGQAGGGQGAPATNSTPGMISHGAGTSTQAPPAPGPGSRPNTFTGRSSGNPAGGAPHIITNKATGSQFAVQPDGSLKPYTPPQ